MVHDDIREEYLQLLVLYSSWKASVRSPVIGGLVPRM